MIANLQPVRPLTIDYIQLIARKENFKLFCKFVEALCNRNTGEAILFQRKTNVFRSPANRHTPNYFQDKLPYA